MASHPAVRTPWRETDSSCECDPNTPFSHQNSLVDERGEDRGPEGSPEVSETNVEPVSVGGILQEFFTDLGPILQTQRSLSYRESSSGAEPPLKRGPGAYNFI